MNAIRKVVYCLLAVSPMLASPSFAAPAKLYDLAMCVGTFANRFPTTDLRFNADPKACAANQTQGLNQPTGPTYTQARVFNQSPPKATNSSINSIDLFVDVNWRVLNTPAKPVKVLDNTGKSTFDVSQANHLKISGLAPVKPQEFVTVEFYVDGFSCGDGRWNVIPYTGTGFTGAPFTAPDFVTKLTTVACAQLACNQFITAIQPQGQVSTTSLNYIARLERGTNQDGTTGASCTSLFAYQTPTPDGNFKTLVTVWDKNHDDSDVAIFSHVVNLEPTTGVTTAPGKLSQMKIAWLFKNDGVTLDYQNALMCDPKANSLPIQYTTLVADDGSRITVASSLSAPAVPFSIVVEQERMLVTKINTNTNVWTVTRPTGGTSPPLSAHPVDAPVMSTPFPIVQLSDGFIESDNTYVGKVAPSCVSAITPVAGDTTGTQFTATVIDGVDPGVRIGGF